MDMSSAFEELFGPDHNDEEYDARVMANDSGSSSSDEDEENNMEVEDDDNVSFSYEDEFMEDEGDVEHVPDEDEAEMMLNGPKVNMEFKNRSSMFDAYQAFAKSKGFAVVNRNSRPSYVILGCSRGRKTGKEKRTKRIGCRVRLNATKESGLWRVTNVVSDHNHAIDPSMSAFMPAHKNLTINMKRQAVRNDISGLRVCKTMRQFEVEAGGPQNVGVSARDLRNYIDKRRRLRLGEGDAEAIRQLFMRLQQKDRNFFYTMDIDDKGRLRNVLWIHPRSKAAYQGDFGDVVSFDTTYLVNTYDMPFGSVVGVNHHNQSILLGCALISNEDSKTFKWLWSSWLEAMGGVAPPTIITYQCGGIKNALQEVMPETIHRYCVWHIVKKAPQKFKKVGAFQQCLNEFNSVIYNSRTINEFEDCWNAFLKKFGLQNNGWCKELWEERTSWVGVYLNHYFWAGMRSTQRSESMHAFYDGFLNSKTTLKIFVEQYEVAVADKIHKEIEADYESQSKMKRCISTYPWEVQFRDAYTNNIFDLVQKEVFALMHCNVVQLGAADIGIEEFNVVEVNGGHRFNNKVEFRPNGDYFKCDCKKFESRGIICRHIMKVLVEKDIGLVNGRYILRRWRKDVYRLHSSIFFAGGYPHMTDEYKAYQRVEAKFIECTDLAINSQAKMEHIQKRCEELKKELLKWKEPRNVVIAGTSSVVGESPATNSSILGDPPRVKRRGRPTLRVSSEANKRMLIDRGRASALVDNQDDNNQILNENATTENGSGSRGRGRGRGGRRGRGSARGSNLNTRQNAEIGTQESIAH